LAPPLDASPRLPAKTPPFGPPDELALLSVPPTSLLKRLRHASKSTSPTHDEIGVAALVTSLCASCTTVVLPASPWPAGFIATNDLAVASPKK
jgi:hypothetical protein